MMSICIYTFKSFPIKFHLPGSTSFICFQEVPPGSQWTQHQLPLDVFPFSSVRQERIIKLLPWKYLAEYDYAIWCASEEHLAQALLLAQFIQEHPNKDVYLPKDSEIDKSFWLQLFPNNLNVKSQLQKYYAANNWDPSFFYSTDLIAFNNRSASYKQFSINWMNETLKESLNDEISFSWLLSFSSLDVCEFDQEKEVAAEKDCFFRIAIPNYNNGLALERCIESILYQTFKSFKIVVVDDCSTDESRKTAERYAEDYPEQVFFLSTKKRSGSGAARNLGASFSGFTSEYTWFVDGDDELSKDSVLKSLFEKASIAKADLVSFDCAYLKDKKVEIKKFSVPDFNDQEKVLEQFGIAPWHRIVKTEKVVPFFENCTRRQDLATVFRQYANCETLAHLDKVCYDYNVRDYASLKEPVWSLQNVYLELIEQTKQLPEKYSNAIKRYVAKYPKVFGSFDEKKLKEQRVVAMASYPKRKEGMLKAFKELFPQCDHFCLYLNEYEKIPDELLELSSEEKRRITIAVGQENLKDYGKFYWWKKFPGYYLTVDDDLEYAEDYVERLVSRMKDFNDNSILGFHGNDFDTVDNSFVAKKHCHAFLSEEKHDVPVDCLGTGAACFKPEKFSFSFDDILENFCKDQDLDMSVSILVKSEGKMLYRIASEKNVVQMNSEGINFVNPLADVHFAWENRYLQYGFWLHRDSNNKACAFCCATSKTVDLETIALLSKLREEKEKEGVDFYFIPIEEKALLADPIQMYFSKFDLVKKFVDKYYSVSILPIGEKELQFDFTKENHVDLLSKIQKVKDRKPKRMSDKLLKANLRKM